MRIITDITGEIFTDAGAVLYVPPAQMTISGRYFHTVIAAQSRPVTVEIAAMTQVNEATNVPIVSVKFADVLGWIVFVESAQASVPKRTKWYINDLNQGAIGGDWQGFDPNLFPDFTYQLYEGRLWRVYISSYRTRISDLIQFRA